MSKIVQVIVIIIIIAADLFVWSLMDFKGLFSMVAIPVGVYACMVLAGAIINLFSKNEERDQKTSA